MESYIKFFNELGKLKFLKRRGWVLRGIKNPESVADHAFRVLILAWVFGKDTKLSMRKLLKLALVHSFSAVHIDYISPYNQLLEHKSKKDLLHKYPALLLRAPVDKKEIITALRFEEEKKAVASLIKDLPESIQNEIRYLWIDFQKKTSREAKYIWVLDKLENLIQALEYKNQMGEELLRPFLQQMLRITNDKKILDFVESLNQFFEKGKEKVERRRNVNLIKFLLKVGKAKKVIRNGWVIRGVKNPETLASHCFRSAVFAWIFSLKRPIKQDVAIITAIIHDLYTIESGDITPYDTAVRKARDGDEKIRIVDALPWLGSRYQKEIIAKKRLQEESKSLHKVLRFLSSRQRHELKYFWLAYKTGTSREGRYFRQIDRIEALIQALEYQTEDKKLPIKSFWLQLKELLDDPLLIEFVQSVDDRYFQKGFKSL